MADGQLYTKQLLCKALGYPLWYPPPMDNLPEAYRKHGIQIGDVGCITPRGGFSFLFNICKNAEDPINHHFGVPDKFQPLKLDARFIERMDVAFQPHTDISTETVRSRRVSLGVETNSVVPIDVGMGIELSCSANEGAALILPTGASSSDLLPLHIFRKYILTHAKQWFEFLATLNRPVQDIYLITGCDKSSSWGTAVFSRTSNAGEVTMKLGPTGTAGHAEYAWDTSSYNHGFAQAGPHRKPGEESWAENQCVFLRGYTVSMRNKLKSALTGQVKVDAIKGSSPSPIQASLSQRISKWPSQSGQQPTVGAPSSSSGSGTSPNTQTTATLEGVISLQYSSEISQAYHPSAVINTFILDRSQAVEEVIAITHDSDWMAAIVQDTQFPNDQELFDSVSRVRDVADSGASVVYWNTRDTPESLSMSSGSPAALPSLDIQDNEAQLNDVRVVQRSQGRVQYTSRQTGPAESRVWETTVFFDGLEYGRAVGFTERSAREAAAAQVLSLLGLEGHLGHTRATTILEGIAVSRARSSSSVSSVLPRNPNLGGEVW
ncbi:hypothetical protein C8R46DRAFT_1142004, partial [Mycena filopes]